MGEGTQQARAVLALPVEADEEEARYRPLPFDRRRDVVAADADDMDLLRRDAVVIEHRLGGPGAGQAASGRHLVGTPLALHAGIERAPGQQVPARVGMRPRLRDRHVLIGHHRCLAAQRVAGADLDHAVKPAGAMQGRRHRPARHRGEAGRGAGGLAGVLDRGPEVSLRAHVGGGNGVGADREQRRRRLDSDRHRLDAGGLEAADQARRDS